ncbi:MAG: ThiF family adenylyltransferase [Bdellovibrionota bacterium]|nr:thiamine biosynthesis protein ThiF [Pseudobdellovibrionaceae bacterium]|tara:strand:- start:17311 stop:18216 length:906 start_codon:yes stop_codon:yes gene_type:complete
MFDYSQFIQRNIGFVNLEEQAKLKEARIFVAGVGGMGGAAVACLARAGVENFIIADLDEFELSNLNRQIFANRNTIGVPKAEATKQSLLDINPNINIKLFGKEWSEKLDEILPNVDLVINGCDDAKASVHLLRSAPRYKKTVIDAFASTLPNVYVVGPNDPRPEKTLGYATYGKNLNEVTEDEWGLCIQKEIEYVLVHSSSAKHVVLDVAAEMVSGARSRISFAPMVWTTGCFMAYEATKIILGEKTKADYKGVFFNPYRFEVERPYGFIIGSIRRFLVRRFLKSLLPEEQKDFDMRKLNA